MYIIFLMILWYCSVQCTLLCIGDYIICTIAVYYKRVVMSKAQVRDR